MTKLISFYLPQFHPIPENNKWWGNGFTEWRNVVKANPLFNGHYQPHIPADLGFYDLRSIETRLHQAYLAQRYGIYGFCYYHYWFYGRRLLSKPIDDILISKKPEMPYCLCWANENWTRRWDGKDNEILIEQKYSPEDDLNHVKFLINHFKDERYIKVEGKPVFLVYRAMKLPNPKLTVKIWRQTVKDAGLKDLYLIKVNSVEDINPSEIDFDAAIDFHPHWNNMPAPINRGVLFKLLKFFLIGKNNKKIPMTLNVRNKIYDYRKYIQHTATLETPKYKIFPSVMPSWDNSARRDSNATIFINSRPQYYSEWLSNIIHKFKPFSKDEDFVFINAWNEWGEGNHLEPDLKYGHQYLQETLNCAKSLD